MNGHQRSSFDNDYEEDFNQLDEFPDDLDDDEVLVSQTNIFQKQSPQKIPVYERQLPTPQVIYGSRRPNQNRLSAGTKSSIRNVGLSTKDRSRQFVGESYGMRKPTTKLSSVKASSKNDFARQTTIKDHMAERVLSAKARRVHDLENERNLLRIQADTLKQEVKTLNLMLRRQGRALGQYENKDEKFPTLLQQAEEEVRITREHLRNSKQKYAQLREQYRQLENYSQSTEKDRDRLAAIVRDKQLLDSKAIKQDRDNLSKQLEASEHQLKDADRRIANLQRKHAQERQFFDLRFKELLCRQEGLEAENFVIKHRLVQLGQAVPDNVSEPRKRQDSRSRSHDAQRSRTTNHQQRSSSRDDSIEVEENKLQNLETRIYRNAKPSFLKEFRYATGTIPENPLSGHESPASIELASSTHAGSSEQRQSDNNSQGSSAPIIRKTRMSPDLLKDHNDRARARELDQSPSVPNSSESLRDLHGLAPSGIKDAKPLPDIRVAKDAPEEIPHKKLIQDFKSPENVVTRSGNSSELQSTDNELTQTKDEKVMLKNDLLEKIRQLDLAKRDLSAGDSVRKEKDSEKQSKTADSSSLPRGRNGVVNDALLIDELSHGDAPFSSTPYKSDKLSYNTPYMSSRQRALDMDDDIEEIEFF
ncbi:uncharacterized protein LOC129583604 [Paramacrobiotus metropolitanus]|uniref:uncharacterized protein LOC129583604 n=1 Tax=Paramacrobiotus metropolitanus TaxID=2943436 RepID=UPI0024460EC9|nr:uncharacterized protein LOC129583604 [Paramacrobiotus metropolitanus]XP_055331443.1 uncharacterized protein LOC129583604 [Paramacrobiotus metropolitanus]